MLEEILTDILKNELDIRIWGWVPKTVLKYYYPKKATLKIKTKLIIT